MFGWSKSEVVDFNFFDFLIPEKDRPHVKGVVDSLLKGELSRHSINENLTKEGEIITCDCGAELEVTGMEGDTATLALAPEEDEDWGE